MTNRLIFISHSAIDAGVVRLIGKEVKAIAKCDVFISDFDIQKGADTDEVIRNHLDRADEFVILLTPWALERPWIWVELGGAFIRRIPIACILHGLTFQKVKEYPGCPNFLLRGNMFDIRELPLYLSELKKRSQ